MGIKKTIGFVILLVLGISIIYLVLSTVFPSMSNDSVNLEAVTFIANNTAYPLSNPPIYLSEPYTPILYHTENTTYPIDTAKYTFMNSTHLKIYTNNTYNANETYAFNCATPSNITNNCTYYASYEYAKQNWIGGQNWTWIAYFIFLIVAFSAMLKFDIF